MLKKTAILLLLAIAFNAIIYFFIWDHRLFVVGLNPFVAVTMLLLFGAIAIPLAIFGLKRLARYYKGRFRFTPAVLSILGAFIFLMGAAIHELVLGSSTFDIQVQDTYYVIAHGQAMLIPALIFLIFAAVYYCYPRIIGRDLNQPMGYIHFAITLAVFYLLIWPSFYTGLAGMPRRYIDYGSGSDLIQLSATFTLKTKALILLICGQFIFLINLIYSALKRKHTSAA